MKKILFKYISSLMILMLLISLIPIKPADAATVKLNKKKLSIEVGETYNLKISGTTKTVKWSSTNKKIAKVKDGKVTAVAPGKCNIKAKVDGKTYKCKVTVKASGSVTIDGVKVKKYNDVKKYSVALTKMIKEYEPDDPSVLSGTEVHSNRVIVSGKPDFKDYKPVDSFINPWGEYILQFKDAETAQKFIKKQKNNKNVKYAEEDVYVTVCNSVIETAAASLGSWGTSYVEAKVLADYIVKEGIKRKAIVAVVDTGVDLDHPLFKDRIASGGYDYVDGDGDPDDDIQGHGTHVAGIIVDCTPGLDVKILPIRVLSAKGGYVSDVSCGIRYAADLGADVINLSLGGEHAETKDSAIVYAINKGSTVVVAAGNDSTDTSKVCPAHIKKCIVVSAIDEDENKAVFSTNGGSNYGTAVDIAAPGKNIYSSYPEGKYKKLSGTSMAAPHVAAAAAMIKILKPNYSPEEVEEYLKINCTKDLGVTGRDDVFGYGSLKLSKVVPAEVKNISVSKLPYKTQYFAGEMLDISGMEITVTYSDGRKETLKSGFTCLQNNLDFEGTTNITVSYMNLTTSFSVMVVRDNIVSIGVSVVPDKTVYYLGDYLDTTNLVLKAKYASGKEENIYDGYSCSPNMFDVLGNQTITVSYQNCVCTYGVYVSKPELISLSVTSLPVKLEYYTGENLDTTGLRLVAEYSNGESKTVDSGFVCSSPNMINGKLESQGEQSIIVTYDDCTTSFNIMVKKIVYSDWTPIENIPAGASVVNKKWSYKYTETTKSYNSNLDGWVLNKSDWEQTDQRYVFWANFPAYFNTSHSLYTSSEKSQPAAYEYTDTKRTVENVQDMYIYWHWMYSVNYHNTVERTISDRSGSYDAYGNSGGFYYQYFDAFCSSVDCPYLDNYYCCSRNQPSYNCVNVMPDKTSMGTGTPRYFRFSYHKCLVTDYRKEYYYSKTENKESVTEINPGNGVSDVVCWVIYEIK